MTGRVAKNRIASINVTPMADVIIVLLIIFMVTVPMMDEGPVRTLPEAVQVRSQDRGPIVVSIAADSSLFVDGARLTNPKELSARLRAGLEVSAERLVHVKADSNLPYEKVAKVLEMCRAAGAAEVALIAKPRPGA